MKLRTLLVVKTISKVLFIYLKEDPNMNNTALGAESKKEQTINFISEAHEKLKEVRYQDVYHKALCYCLGISDDTRRNINSIYDFKTGCVKTECLHEGWQTSSSMKVVRMAFNLLNITVRQSRQSGVARATCPD